MDYHVLLHKLDDSLVFRYEVYINTQRGSFDDAYDLRVCSLQLPLQLQTDD